jgi:hypothetical protein
LLLNEVTALAEIPNGRRKELHPLRIKGCNPLQFMAIKSHGFIFPEIQHLELIADSGKADPRKLLVFSRFRVEDHTNPSPLVNGLRAAEDCLLRVEFSNPSLFDSVGLCKKIPADATP